jgi:hypothetical protein
LDVIISAYADYVFYFLGINIVSDINKSISKYFTLGFVCYYLLKTEAGTSWIVQGDVLAKFTRELGKALNCNGFL